MKKDNLFIPLGILILGILTSFGSFIFALLNMAVGMWNMMNGDGNGFLIMFVLHIVAMIGLAIGGLITTVGFYFGGWTLLKSYVLPYLASNTKK